MRFFLPLCGKAGDLVHLYNEGHNVTGVEGVPFVVEQFFRENNLEYEKASLPEIRGWKYNVSIGILLLGMAIYSLTCSFVDKRQQAVYLRL